MEEMIIYAELSKKTVPRIVIHLVLDNLLRISAITLAYTQRFRLFAKKVRLGVDKSITFN